MVAGEYGLWRGTCSVAGRLEMVADAELLWISYCVFGYTAVKKRYATTPRFTESQMKFTAKFERSHDRYTTERKDTHDHPNSNSKIPV